MQVNSIQAILPLINQRFASFGDAAEATLAALADAVPGTILLVELQSEDARCRVIDVRGHPIAGVGPGALLPLAAAGEPAAAANGSGAQGPRLEGSLDRDFLRSRSIASELSVPLEMSDGHLVAVITALAAQEGAYRADHVLLLGLAARVLGHEWESVRSRAEIRRLRQRLRDRESTDPGTGLPNRESLVDLLTREWQLVKRGSVQSMVVVCHVEADGADGQAQRTLALKDAAEVLAGSLRNTDHAGRTGEMKLAAVMVGCHDIAGAQAFIGRYEAALARATRGRATRVAVSCGAHSLADSQSPVEALEIAERAALAAAERRNDDQGPVEQGAQT